MIKLEIKNLLKNGLKEIDLSNYPFGKVKDVLEDLGYEIGTYKDNKYNELEDWTNGWELDYWADIFLNGKYTGFTLTGSFLYGTCTMAKYEIYN